jgi:hypothetical protein
MNSISAWERLETDTDKSFEAFCIYRDMGASRSLSKVGQKLGKSGALIERWSTQHDWQNRVVAFDTFRDSQNLDENAERQKLIKDNAYSDYLTLREAIENFKLNLKTVRYIGVNAYEISTLASLMKQADDYARRAVGLPDKVTEQKTELYGKDGGAIETTVIIKTGMSLDDL